MTDNLPPLYTEDEAAAYLGLNPRTLARLRKRGQIGFVEIADRRYRYREEHLLTFIAARARGPKPTVQRKAARPERGLPPNAARIIFGVPKRAKPRP